MFRLPAIAKPILYLGNDSKMKALQLWLAFIFPFATILALGIDSVYFWDFYFDGRQLINILSIGYFLLMFSASGKRLRKLMAVMVVISYIGELIFCKVLGMYTYRSVSIPLYVPFGHAIVYATGYILASTAFVKNNYKYLAKIFPVIFCCGFILAILFFGDMFTLVFGCMFFILLRRKRWDNLYYCIALCVVFIELTGTFFKCWVWEAEVFGALPTANPPIGAVFFYAGGDILIAKIVSLSEKKKLSN